MRQEVLLYCDSVASLLRHAQASAAQWLSDDEAKRLHDFTRQQRREQFIAGRWLARQALVTVHGGSPIDWRLSAQPDEPPTVEGGPCIGIAHSGDLVACVLSAYRLGVDVESPARRVLDVPALGELSLNDAERVAVLAEPDPAEAYLMRWTLKEAFIKQRGGRPSLADVATAPCGADEANARAWQSGNCTLALVGLSVSAAVTLAGEMAPRVAPTTWRVTLTSA